jgi:outer membrane protein
MANEQINLMNLENSLRQSKLALCQLMRMEMNLDLSLERLPEATLLPYEKNASAVYAASRENMAVFKSNGLKVKAMDKGLHVARSGFMPTVSLTGNLGSSYSSLSNRFIPTGSSEEETGQFVRFQGTESPVLVNQTHYNSEKIGYSRQMKNNLGVFAGVSLQVPVFNGFYASNQVRLATLNQKRAMLDLETNEQQMKQNIEQAWLLMDMAWRKQDLIRQQVSDFETSFQAAKTRLENGVISAAEFLIAKNNADRSRLSGVQATYEYQFRTRILDYYQGKQVW